MSELIKLIDSDQILGSLKEFEICFPHLKEKINDFSLFAIKLSKFANVYVLQNNDINIGFLAFYSNDTIDYCGYITLIGVKPLFQKGGFGRKIINQCIKNMKNDGMKKVRLEVDIDNLNAQEFYEHIGFKKTGMTDFNSIYMEKVIE